MNSNNFDEFPDELVNHILAFRPTHPNATLIKNLNEKFYKYRLPSGSPVWEPDENGVLRRYSAPLICCVPSFIYYDEPVSFSEWYLYFLPNAYELWANEYQYW